MKAERRNEGRQKTKITLKSYKCIIYPKRKQMKQVKQRNEYNLNKKNNNDCNYSNRRKEESPSTLKVLILRLVDTILLDVSVFQHYQEKGEKVKTSGDSRVTKSLVEVITQTYYNFSDNPKPVINLQEMSERLKLTQQTHTHTHY